MAKLNDLTGKTFNFWEVLYRNGSKNSYAVWRCKCLLCGKEYDIVGQSLIQGTTTKCRSCSTKIAKQSEFTNSPIKYIFSGMWQRCYDKNHKYYDFYGGRGIKICDEWLKDRKKFYKWAYSNGYKKGLSIERKDFNGDYCPENCCFIPKNQQNGNRRNSIMISIEGRTQCLSWWCKELNINREKVKWLVKSKGISYEEALNVLSTNKYKDTKQTDKMIQDIFKENNYG